MHNWILDAFMELVQMGSMQICENTPFEVANNGDPEYCCIKFPTFERKGKLHIISVVRYNAFIHY